MKRILSRAWVAVAPWVVLAGCIALAPPAEGWTMGTTNFVLTPGGNFFSSAAIGTNGTIYVGSKSHGYPCLYALRPNGTTQHIWTLAGRTYAPPSIGRDGTIYVGCESNLVYALNPDGTTQRTWSTGCRIVCNPAIARDGTIYVVGYYDSRLYSFDPDGTTNGVWEVSPSAYVIASPVLNSNDQVLVLGSSGDLCLVNPDGTTQTTWHVGTSGSYSTPAIGSDGTIYVGGLDKNLYAFNPDGTTQRHWTAAKSIDYSSVAIGTNSVLYVGDTGGNLYGFHVDGTTQHVWTADDDIYSSPSIGADGTIYVGSNSGTNLNGTAASNANFYAFNADGTTSTVWSLKVVYSSARIQASAAIGPDGTVCIGSYDDDTVFILPGTGGTLMNSPWPKYGQNRFNTARPWFGEVTPDSGPSTGGVVAVVSSQLLGSGSDITNVTFGGVSAGPILGQGIGWVRVRVPAGIAGPVDVAVDSTIVGVHTIVDGYWANYAGVIGIDVADGWTEVRGLPAARKYAAGGALDAYVYAVAGTDASDSTNVYRFDGSAWSEVAGLPDIRSRMGVAAYSNLLYAVGGYRTSDARTNVYAFDGASWTQVAGLPAPRHSPAVGVLGGYLYAVGGATNAGPATNVFRFNGSSWTEVAGLPAKRYGAAAMVSEDALYVAGGYNPFDVAMTNVFRFDGATWSEIRGLPAGQAYAGAAVLSGSMNVIGGTASSNVYRFDGTNWVEGSVMPAHRYAFAGGVLDGFYYAAGGAGPAGVARTNAWRYIGRAYQSGVDPSQGPTAGGFAVAIWGSNLCDGTLSDVLEVTLCGVSATIDAAASTQILVTAGSRAGGAFGDVKVVSTAFGTTWGSNRFAYESTDLLILGTNGQAIANGASPNGSRGTDFGMLHSGTSVTHTLTITNTGSSALTISGWTTNGQVIPAFTVTNIPSSVPAGGAASFTVNFAPPVPAGYTAALVIANNAAGSDSNYVVCLRGRAYALSTYRGPAIGGNNVTVTNGLLGNGADITNVLVNGARAPVLLQGPNWVRVTMPSGQAGPATILVQSASKGTVVFPDAYFYDPYIRVIASPRGSVSPSGVVLLNYGASTSFVATAFTYFHIAAVLTNGAPDAAAAGLIRYTSTWNNVTATGTLVAVFEDNLTANTGTPEAWLARFGWTNDFEAAATNDPDGDLVPTSDEYVADTIPINGDSYLRFVATEPGSVTWAGGTTVVQFLEADVSVGADEWQTLAVGTPPMPTTNSAEVSVEDPNCFFRVRAER